MAKTRTTAPSECPMHQVRGVSEEDLPDDQYRCPEGCVYGAAPVVEVPEPNDLGL